MSYLDLADRSWPVLGKLMGAHSTLYRATNGIVGHKFPGTPKMLLLDHVGAKSGIERTAPLVYFTDGADVVIVASKGGYPKNPAWFYNLAANPDTKVQIGSEKRLVRARVATSAEHDRLWPMAVETYSGYASYQERTDRTIPLVVLEPRTG
ncbi:MAG: nitroreductase family deazaflavin-dependent oxidoreductase [Solirubrobacterales bacterium]